MVLVLVLVGGLLSAGCSSVSYYAQAVRGQLDVVAASRPVEEILADAGTDPEIRQRLSSLPALRQFAFDELGLADSGSYRSFADLQREAMVWSVVAAPVDSFEPHQWCYPILGCASYRGYFDRSAAQQHAARMAAAGWDVAIEPVPAYSTLGWFDDPLPSTVIHWPVAEIAALLFHELAHETLYIRDDSAFNEAFATLVEREGVRRWLARSGTTEARERHRERVSRRRDFLRLIRATRVRLSGLYATDVPADELVVRKRLILDDLRQAYRAQKTAWGGYTGYDRWFERPLNNAHFASIGTYNTLMPVMRQLLRQADGDMQRFHAACRELSEMSSDRRRRQLRMLATAARSGADQSAER